MRCAAAVVSVLLGVTLGLLRASPRLHSADLSGGGAGLKWDDHALTQSHKLGQVSKRLGAVSRAVHDALDVPLQQRSRDEATLRAVVDRARTEAATEVIEDRLLWTERHLRDAREAFAAAAEALAPVRDDPSEKSIASSVGKALSALRTALQRVETQEQVRAVWDAALLRAGGDARSTGGVFENASGQHPLLLHAVDVGGGGDALKLRWHPSGHVFVAKAPPVVWPLRAAARTVDFEQVKDMAVAALSAALGREVSTKGRWAAFNPSILPSATAAVRVWGSVDAFVAVTKVATINGCQTTFGVAPTDRMHGGPRGRVRRRRARSEVGWALMSAPKGGAGLPVFTVRREGILSSPHVREILIRGAEGAATNSTPIGRALVEDPRMFTVGAETWVSLVVKAEVGSKHSAFHHGLCRTVLAPLRVNPSSRRPVEIDAGRAVQYATARSSMEKWREGAGFEHNVVVFETVEGVWAESGVEPHFVCRVDLRNGRCGAVAGLPEYRTSQPLIRVLTLGKKRVVSSPQIAVALSPPQPPPREGRSSDEYDDSLQLPFAAVSSGAGALLMPAGFLKLPSGDSSPVFLSAAHVRRQGWMCHHFWYAFTASPPFSVCAISHEWCMPYDTSPYPGSAEGLCPVNDTCQQVSGMWRDAAAGAVVVAFGEQDCSSRVARIPEKDIAESLRAVAA